MNAQELDKGFSLKRTLLLLKVKLFEELPVPLIAAGVVFGLNLVFLLLGGEVPLNTRGATMGPVALWGHGTLKLQRDWVSVDDLIGSARQRLKRFFPQVELEYQSSTDLPLLYAHAALLEQGLFNILENAAKYSPEGEPIKVWISKVGSLGQTLCRIEIEDSGPGIPEDLREKVFDMFYVVADGDSKRHNTGMGLAICRGMIGAHGGTVKAVAARSGTGSRFVVELPFPETQSGD